MPDETAAERPRPKSRQWAQLQLTREQFGHRAEPGPLIAGEEDIKFWVRSEFVLVRDQFANRVREHPSVRVLLPERYPDSEPPQRPDDDTPVDGDVAYGMQYVRLQPGIRVLTAVDTINQLFRGVAHPEYLLHVTPNDSTGSGCPATEPEPVPPCSPPRPAIVADQFAGRGVRVVVIDSGVDHPTVKRTSWLRGLRGDDDLGVAGPAGPTHDPYAGHGTFIAGVVRAMAPRARVVVRRGFPVGGCTWESAIAAALEQVLQNDHPDVISLSAGTYAAQPGGLSILNGFADEILPRYKDVAIVAAAGNDGWPRRFWPAAAPWTTSVGALADDWHSRAWFSNHGGWVDVYAPGEDLVNAFPRGDYEYRERKRHAQVAHFRGMARWSGTSFSTPVVAGLIAARMSRTGENGRTAAAALVAEARANAVPGVGAVLLG